MVFSNSCYKSFSVLKEHPWSPAWDVLVEKPIYAKVENNKITMAEDKLRLKRKLNHFFSLKHDTNLWAVNQRLKSIYDQTMQGQGKDFENLKNEIHRLGANHFSYLSENLLKLDKSFKNANRENILLRVVKRIVNNFCTLFHLKKPNVKRYEEIDMKMFIEKLKSEALELTAQEKNGNPFSLEIQGQTIPKELTEENLKKLFFNLNEYLIFNFGNDRVKITIDVQGYFTFLAFNRFLSVERRIKIDEALELKDPKQGTLTIGFHKEQKEFKKIHSIEFPLKSD